MSATISSNYCYICDLKGSCASGCPGPEINGVHTWKRGRGGSSGTHRYVICKSSRTKMEKESKSGPCQASICVSTGKEGEITVKIVKWHSETCPLKGRTSESAEELVTVASDNDEQSDSQSRAPKPRARSRASSGVSAMEQEPSASPPVDDYVDNDDDVTAMRELLMQVKQEISDIKKQTQTLPLISKDCKSVLKHMTSLERPSPPPSPPPAVPPNPRQKNGKRNPKFAAWARDNDVALVEFLAKFTVWEGINYKRPRQDEEGENDDDDEEPARKKSKPNEKQLTREKSKPDDESDHTDLDSEPDANPNV